LIDPSSLGVLANRAADDRAAKALHAKQLDLLGSAPPTPERPQSKSQRAEQRRKRIPCGRSSPRRLADLLAAASGPDVGFVDQRQPVTSGLAHSHAKGAA